jgi:ribosomal protein L11 methyltransferase
VSIEANEPAVSEPVFAQVHVRVAADDVDLVSGLLFELGASGVEERDETTFLRAPDGAGVLLVASFDGKADAEAAIEALGEYEAVTHAEYVELVGDAWRDAWKEHFEPFKLTPGIVVRPPWRERPAWAEGHLVLELEPGRAFGTGLHATTSLVATYLDEHAAALAGKEILDAGTGSGILSFVALAHGAARAVAFDNDAEVIGVVEENADRNAFRPRLHAFAGTIEEVEGTFAWVVANIESRVLLPIADALAARLAPGGTLLLSGVLAHEHPALLGRYGKLEVPLDHVCSRFQGEGDNRWVMIALRRRA